MCGTWRGSFWYGFFFFSSRRRHTRCSRDWSSDVALPICAYHAVVDTQLLDWKPEFLRSRLHQQAARFGRRAAQGAGARLDSGAAGGSPLVAGERGVAHDDVDLGDLHVELVRYDLRDRDVERL